METEVTQEQELNHGHDLDKVIQESKEKLFEAQKVEPKRKRGRPRKVEASQNSEAPTPTLQVETAQGVASTPDISPYLIDPLIAVSKFPANKHKIPELALTREEAELCAKSLNEVLKAFVPDMQAMDPKTAAVLGAFVTFGSIGFSKGMIYKMEMEKRYTEKQHLEPDAPIEKAKTNVESENIPAGSYFKKINV